MRRRSWEPDTSPAPAHGTGGGRRAKVRARAPDTPCLVYGARRRARERSEPRAPLSVLDARRHGALGRPTVLARPARRVGPFRQPDAAAPPSLPPRSYSALTALVVPTGFEPV